MAFTIFALSVLSHSAHSSILAYAGPDQILPIASILGAVIGFLLIVWQRVVAFMKWTWIVLKRKMGRETE
jgi:hypothetical protein